MLRTAFTGQEGYWANGLKGHESYRKRHKNLKKNMADEPETPETEEYAVSYVVNITATNCTINITQSGKPKDPPPPPGGG